MNLKEFKGKFTALNRYITKEQGFQFNDIYCHLKKLEKKN